MKYPSIRKLMMYNLSYIEPPHSLQFIQGNDSMDGVFDGAFGGVGDEEVVVGEGVVVTSSSLEMLKNSCLRGIMINLIFLEGFEEEAFVEFVEYK
ncbi:hypothetical protein Tco_0823073 [Tanacetum coccineum]|uniref:Uncharacterized protein n=1 Tax=Tanacetum coccineum TaxID=301880 RepID=A0ABQ5ALF5_9ASTR